MLALKNVTWLQFYPILFPYRRHSLFAFDNSSCQRFPSPFVPSNVWIHCFDNTFCSPLILAKNPLRSLFLLWECAESQESVRKKPLFVAKWWRGKEEGGSQEEREERNRISRSHFPHFAQQPLLIAKSAKCRETRAEFFPMNKEKRNFSPSNSGNISYAQLGWLKLWSRKWAIWNVTFEEEHL